MKERKYCQEIMRIWKDEIKRAENLISWTEADPEMAEDFYFVPLNPEDFLDLCAGKWHSTEKSES